MLIFTYFFIGVLGLLIGSFIGALSYRLPLGVKIYKGRSFCPKCKKQIEWYDNIPLVSYLILGGKCRHCHKEISARYPFIEASTAILFLVAYARWSYLGNHWLASLGNLGLIFVIFLTAILITIFVIDWEHQIIPDSLTFLGLAATLVLLLISNNNSIYSLLLSGLSAASFLLAIHILTWGRGMGLGDVKFALLAGILLGPINTIGWMMLSFMIGGLTGIILIVIGKAKMSQKIAFGPFLIVAFFVAFYTSVIQSGYENFFFGL